MNLTDSMVKEAPVSATEEAARDIFDSLCDRFTLHERFAVYQHLTQKLRDRHEYELNSMKDEIDGLFKRYEVAKSNINY